LIAYADTGFLISLYGEDANSTAATALLKSRPVFSLTSLGELEFMTALELRVFRKEWTRRVANLVREQFLADQATGAFRIEPFHPEIWDAALALSRRHSAALGARSLDLLHVASARVLRADVFFAFDERQRQVAKSENLHVLPS
jgi:predicted nucleic acid-binding protein